MYIKKTFLRVLLFCCCINTCIKQISNHHKDTLETSSPNRLYVQVCDSGDVEDEFHFVFKCEV